MFCCPCNSGPKPWFWRRTNLRNCFLKSIQGVGRCKFAFWFAVFHDILGLLILLSGVFWNIFFHDFLVYAGSLIIFLSLIWWVFWYSGNIEVPPAELEDDIAQYKKSKGISGVVRKVSNRISNGLRNSFRKSGRSGRQVSPQPATHLTFLSLFSLPHTSTAFNAILHIT
uniref:Si:dkey-16i5.8 n=1 Tax=Astyanax mexicanus TaxID=7994 RepID=W5LTW3_ASTMX